MASLADTPNLVGFFSYSREDDEGSGGRLSKLRERIQEELRAQLGRTRGDFRLWQDRTSIAHGELWEDNIKKAVAESAFFIPIVTPTAVRSRYCKFEFETFLAREKELGRNNLVFPILYIPVPALMGEGWREDPLLAIIGSRQYEQWQNLRHLDPSSPEVALRIEKLCENICKALQQPWLSPQEQQEAEARRVAEDERRRQTKLQEEARRVAEEEHRRQEAEANRRLEEARVEKRRQDNERRTRENEAAWAAKKARALQLLRGKTAAGAAVVALLLIGGIWLYRTSTPTGVTSAAVQPDKQIATGAISASAVPAKPGYGIATPEKSEEGGAATPTAPQAPQAPQSDKQNAENPKGQDTEKDRQQAALKEFQDSMQKQALLATTLENVAKQRLEMQRLVANNLRAGDDSVSIGALGLTVANMSDDLRKRYNIKDTVNGVVITGIEANSPAARNGLSPGYVILTMEYGKTVPNVSELEAEFGKLKGQGSVFFTVARQDGKLSFATLNFPKNAP